MRCVLAAVAFSLFAFPATAQTVERTIDLSGLGWGRIDLTAVDADGDPRTREWLVTTLDDAGDPQSYRVVAERSGSYCTGHWFTPQARRADAWVTVKVITEAGAHKLLVTERWGFFGHGMTVRTIRLDLPSC
jgi:hypothetical protein